MSIPRLRTINGAAQELKKLDPSTAVSAAAIRRLVNRGLVSSLHSGNRAYLNFDQLLDYLGDPTSKIESHHSTGCGIRPVDEQYVEGK